MDTVGVYEAKTRLPKLLDQVEGGATITITRHGKPVALLVPVARHRPSVPEVIESLRIFRQERRLGRSTVRAMVRHGRR
jgi:prevent-host-death family protein